MSLCYNQGIWACNEKFMIANKGEAENIGEAPRAPGLLMNILYINNLGINEPGKTSKIPLYRQ